MIRGDEMGRLLQQVLHEEADAMRVDSVQAAGRLRRNLEGARRTSRLRGVLVAAAIAVLATLVAWSALAGKEAGPASPPPGKPSPATQSASPSPIDSSWPYLLGLDTGAHTPLPWRFVPDHSAAWSVYAFDAATRRLALSQCLVPLPNIEGCQQSTVVLGTLDAAAVSRVRTPSGLVALGVEWSPDGQQLLLPATDGSAQAVPEYYVYGLQTGRTDKITDIPLDHAWWCCSLGSSFSGDGRSVLYDLPRDADQNTAWDVWTVPVEGGLAKVLIRDAKGPRGIPGTDDLAFVRPVRGQWEGSAIALKSGGGPNRNLVVAITGIGVVQASPDGTRLAYNDDDSVWVVDIATGLTERVALGSPGGWLDDKTLLIVP
jgi:Periplasmic component of the Tol biopolymer transport system